MELLLQQLEGSIKVFLLMEEQTITVLSDFSKIHGTNLKKLANFFKLQSTVEPRFYDMARGQQSGYCYKRTPDL